LLSSPRSSASPTASVKFAEALESWRHYLARHRTTWSAYCHERALFGDDGAGFLSDAPSPLRVSHQRVRLRARARLAASAADASGGGGNAGAGAGADSGAAAFAVAGGHADASGGGEAGGLGTDADADADAVADADADADVDAEAQDARAAREADEAAREAAEAARVSAEEARDASLARSSTFSFWTLASGTSGSSSSGSSGSGASDGASLSPAAQCVRDTDWDRFSKLWDYEAERGWHDDRLDHVTLQVMLKDRHFAWRLRPDSLVPRFPSLSLLYNDAKEHFDSVINSKQQIIRGNNKLW